MTGVQTCALPIYYDPNLVDYAIPGNDDAIRAVQLYARAAADAVLEGKAAAPQAATVREEEFSEGDADGKGDKRGPRGPRGAGKKPEGKKPEAAAAAAPSEAPTEAPAAE